MKICKYEGCEKPHKALGLCHSHWKQQHDGRDLSPLRCWQSTAGRDDWPERRPDGRCSYESCERPAKSRGLCNGHYKQQADGRPLAPLNPRHIVRDGMKFCATCGETKPIDQFGKKLHYVTEHCRACRGLKLRAETYGLTVDEVREMVDQDTCECCGAEFLNVRDRCIDHNHRTEAVRGLICQKCNTALGCVDDNVEHLGRLIAYVQSRP